MGRRPGPSTTRAEILEAARESFAARGYEGTSLRSVAASAGVDPALVRRFFGSKEDLLTAALRVTLDPGERLAGVLAGDLDTLGERLVDYFLSVWEQPKSRDVLLAMIRTASTNAHAAQLLRGFFGGEILSRLARAIEDEQEAQLRAAAIGSQIVGLAFYRYLLEVEPIASASTETLRATFGPTLQRYLAEPLSRG
jgi:AcrR family transcriptional regulator